ncbi:response regulator [Halobium salinum]|uniref:Response regulator n=1 Tax=Halobium salinum TaxID=1364940 RepID=A0ABD5P977_9EURY|nr:response regulator [Halobium salinum]
MDRQLSVLHVDDDPSFLRLTGRRIDAEEYRTRFVTATTAEEAFSLLDGGRFDCVVSDSIRTSDGESFVVALRRQYPDLPVVLFTGAEWDRVADDAQRAGVTAYVQKSGETSVETLEQELAAVATDVSDRRTSTDDPGEAAGPTEAGEPHETGELAGTGEVRGAADPVVAGALGDDWVVVATHDWDADAELVVTVVDAVDGILGSDDGRTTLYDVVNGEALEDLLRHRRGDDGTTVVRFPYRGLDLAVTSAGAVAVRRTPAVDVFDDR